MLDAGVVFAAGWADGWAPPPLLDVDDWADEFRVLSRVSSAEHGQWRTSRTPYLREPLKDLSASSPVEEVDLMFGTQLGKTETGNNWTGYTIHVDPAPMMVVQPTQKVGKKWVKQRFKPMRDEMPVLRNLIRDARSRDSGNTADMKEFPGGMLLIAGANSASDLRSSPIAKLYLDEIDNYPYDVDNEGDPVELAIARTDNFPRRKILKTSSPTTRGMSRIEASLKASDFREYHVPCPHCGELQTLVWSNIKWDEVTYREIERTEEDDSGVEVDVARAWYVCRHCGAEIDEHQKTQMLEGGKWIARVPGRRDGKVHGYHLNSLYSPVGWKSWKRCVESFLKAKRLSDGGDNTKLKVWTNTILAETWAEEGDRVSPGTIAQRAEKYPLRSIPAGGLVLVGSADVQGNRIEVKVKAFGRGEESWLVDHVVLHGNPSLLLSGEDPRLHEYVRMPIRNAHGKDMPIAAFAIDSGGHHTHDVYMFARGLKHRHVFAIAGSSQYNGPILGKPSDVEVDFKGVKLKKGAQRWLVGTDTAKAVIYARLRIEAPGPGYMHFPEGLPDDYYFQLTAERLVTRYHKGRAKLEWVKPGGRRNEALDLEVYCLAAAHYYGISRMREADWEKLERQFGRDLFSEAQQPAEDEKPAPDPEAMQKAITSARQQRRAPRKKSFLNRYKR
jgi:phage terminase large subunit GpA-like protein